MSKPAYKIKPTTRNGFYNYSVTVYGCKSCQTWHKAKTKNDKPAVCTYCASTEFYKFDSIAEAKRFGELKLLERSGEIKNIETQVLFPIVVNGIKIFPIGYFADFVYTDANGNTVIEDVKPPNDKAIDPISKVKIKLVSALYGLQVNIVKRR